MTATTSEDAPATTARGGRPKRAIITYATAASIAYLVKNFTSPIAAFRARFPRVSTAPAIASIPPLIPTYEIHARAPPPATPAAADKWAGASAAAASAIAAQMKTASRSIRRSRGSRSPVVKSRVSVSRFSFGCCVFVFSSQFELLPATVTSHMPFVVMLLLQAPPTHSTDTITRTVIADRGGFQALKVEY